MADSLNRPWILKYAIEVAEQYGAKLADVSPNTKKHRVQLVEVSSSLLHIIPALIYVTTPIVSDVSEKP